MENTSRLVSTNDALAAACADRAVTAILVTAPLSGLPAIRLSAGQTLDGGGVSLGFAPGQDGVCLSRDNAVSNVALLCDPDRLALFNDTTVDSLGVLELRGLRVTGMVRLLAAGAVRGGHVAAHGVDVAAADATGWDRRPSGYGVEVVPGAFTLWNMQADPAVRITADLTGISAGRAGAPVRGGGVFVAGAGNGGGVVAVRRLETGEVHSDGCIPPARRTASPAGCSPCTGPSWTWCATPAP